MSPSPDPATDMRSQLLTGLTVIELPHSVAIRYCGRLLAAMGARVLQVGAASTDGVGYGAAASTAYAAWLDAGKTPVSADLARAMAETGSVDLVLAGPGAAAVAEADLAIQTAGDAAGRAALRLGLTWFASDGPYRDWTGSDAVIQAMSGVAYSTGPLDGDPMLPRGHAPQAVAGTVACIAALGALVGRRRGWTGRRIDVDVLSANLCFHESTACSAAADNEPVRRRGVNRFTPTYPAGIYKTLDGWTGLTALTPPQWVALCGLVGQPGLGLDLRHHVTLNRLDDADQLDAVLRPALAQRSSAHWLTEGQALRIPFAPVPTLAELPLTPHWRERASFAPIAGLAQALGPTLPFKVELITAASAGSQPAARSAAAAGSQPLGGLRVLDLTMGWAGPLATRHLADLGADVVKVESCSHVDWWRGYDAMTDADPPAYETRPSFLMVNRHKRGITLDFKTDTGRGLLRRLADGSDLMIENYAPGALNKLGLGTRAMANAVPGLIAVSMGAFGNRGPWSAFRAYGSTVEQASGFPFVNGQASDPPTMQHVAYGDPVAGLYGALACLAAIYRRESAVDNNACLIDLGQVECLFQLAADAIVAQSTQSDALARDGNRHPMSALRMTAGCAAGAAGPAWIAVSVETPAQWQALAGLLGFTGTGSHQGQGLSSKGDFATLLDPPGGPALAGLGALKTHEAELEAAMRAWVATRQAGDAVASLQRAGIPAGPVQPGNTLPEDPQLAALGYFRAMQRRHVGQHLSTQTPYRFDGAALPIGGPAPTLGQHNAELLCDRLGLSAGEYDELLKSGVIGTRATANG